MFPPSNRGACMLQPGPGALTDGIDQIVAINGEWAASAQ
jgi:hypothetical protein